MVRSFGGFSNFKVESIYKNFRKHVKEPFADYLKETVVSYMRIQNSWKVFFLWEHAVAQLVVAL